MWGVLREIGRKSVSTFIQAVESLELKLVEYHPQHAYSFIREEGGVKIKRIYCVSDSRLSD
jgi:hypothetical protein